MSAPVVLVLLLSFDEVVKTIQNRFEIVLQFRTNVQHERKA